jgi:acetyl esterase/lipase
MLASNVLVAYDAVKGPRHDRIGIPLQGNNMTRFSILIAMFYCSFTASARADDWVTYHPKDGPGKGKHIVFLSGDEEYRGEEGLPMLAKILSQRHGFKCTVLFSLDQDGTINPDKGGSLGGAQMLDSADGIVMQLRYRAWPDDAMKHFVDAYHRGLPIVGLRTSTHAFNYPKASTSEYKSYNSFGKNVFGEGWVSHWGPNRKGATRGIIEPSAKDDPILRGVTEIFGDSGAYEVHPPEDVKILVRAQVLKGMKVTDPPADYKKKRASDKMEQGVNDPMMAAAWTRIHKNPAGKENKVFCTTMGAATDMENESLRRLVVNAVYWSFGLEVPAKADVSYVGDFKPSAYSFKGYKKGVKPADLALPAAESPQQKKGELGLVVPAGTRIERDLEYVKNGHERHRLDVYLPGSGDGPFPVVIWLHGGGWIRGSKENCHAAPLVAKGYAAISMNYRFLQQAPFPAQIEDCKAAVRWVRANAKKYHFDPDHIGMMGASAGGHLASLLGTSGGVKELEGQLDNLDQSSRVQAVIDQFGLLRIAQDKTNKSDVLAYITKDAPPFLIVHGDRDKSVPIKQSEQLTAALQKAGVEVTLFTVKGGGHSGPEFFTEEMMGMYERFFDKHLKGVLTLNIR